MRFWRSLTSFRFYQEVISWPLSKTLPYFFLVTSIYALVLSLVIGVTVMKPIKNLLQVMPEKIVGVFPQDLEISVNNGEIHTNVPLPYTLPIETVNDYFNQIMPHIKGITTARPAFLLTIDDSAHAEDYASLQTFILITKNNLIYTNNAGHLEIIPLSQMNGLKINRMVLTSLVHRLDPILSVLWPLMLFGLLISLLVFMPLGLLFFGLIFSVIAVIISRILKLPLKFLSLLQINLHLVLPLSLICGLIRFISPSFSFPDFFSLILLLANVSVLTYLKEPN